MMEPIKPSYEEPPILEMKALPEHLEYAFLMDDSKLPVIINASLTLEQKGRLITLLKKHIKAITWKTSDIWGISPSFCTHKILMKEDYKPVVQPQWRLNPNMKEVVKKEVMKLLDANILYPISEIPWVSPVQVVPKKGGMKVVPNDKGQLIPTRPITSWRICIDYHQLNNTTRKYHFPFPFIVQICSPYR